MKGYAKLLTRLVIVLLVPLLTTSCAFWRVFEKPQNAEYCAAAAKEPCEPLAAIDRDDAKRTLAEWGSQYKVCQLKHRILVECTSPNDEKKETPD